MSSLANQLLIRPVRKRQPTRWMRSVKRNGGMGGLFATSKDHQCPSCCESNKRSCYGVEQLLKERRLGLAEVGRRTFCKDHTVSVVDNAQTCLSACIFIMGQVRCVGFPKACELETTKTSSFMAPVHQCFELREASGLRPVRGCLLVESTT